MAFNYNPGVAYTGASSITHGFDALASGVQNFMEQQREDAQKAQLLEAENAKNDLIINHLKDQGLVDAPTLAEYYGANGKKRSEIASGILTNYASDQLQKQQTAREQQQKLQNIQTGLNIGITGKKLNDLLNPKPLPSFQVQPVAVPGGAPVNVLTGGGMKTPKVIDPQTAPGAFLTPADKAAAEAAGVVGLPTSAKSVQYVTKDGGPKKDTLEKYAKDFKAATGLSPGEWSGSKVVDDSQLGVTVKVAATGKTYTILKPLYDQFANRLQRLNDNATAVAPADQKSDVNLFPDGTKTRKGNQWFIWSNGVPIPMASPTATP